jgi:hypothetical protein
MLHRKGKKPPLFSCNSFEINLYYFLFNESKDNLFSGMTIAAVALFFAGHMIVNQQAFAFGGYGNGPGFGHYYGPGYPVYVPCGGGPYSIDNGQIVCTVG